MWRVGLNAHLLNLSGNYRSAGISWYIYHLLQHLEADQTFAFRVFSNDPRAREHFSLRVLSSRLPTQRPLWRILWEQAVLPLALRREQIDLLHALAFAGPRVISIPWIVTIYDLSFLRFPESFNRANRLYLQWAVRGAVKRARRIIAISESTKRDIVDIYGIPAERVTVIYCGKGAHFTPASNSAELAAWRAQRGLPEKMILHVGTVEPRKNTAMLIRAFARAKHTHAIPQRLVLVGARGWKYREVDAVIEQEGIADQVIFAGYVPQEELHWWYRAADVLAYPSLYEGFGLPPLEAMACGTPVITSNVSSLPEVVGAAALTIDPSDIGALTGALARVVTDRALADEMRARGLQQASKFDWARAAQETTRVYRQVLEEEKQR